ncbi:MAG: amidohydrolase [Deltaproteobacteria bacterium]|nr:amidohydrolase [Deltaproteobacteria bacterium]
MQNLQTIDAWMQHPTAHFLNQDFLASLRRWMRIDRIEVDPPIEMTIASMDDAGVGVGLLSAWWGPTGPLLSNEHVRDAVNAYPDRFRGVAAVPLNKPMAALDELKKCVEEYGFVALRIIQWLWDLPPTHAYFYPLFAACCRYDIPVCLQVGHTGPLMPSEPGRPIPYVDRVALDFPELRIVGGHIGYPWTQEMIAVATKHPNVYIDTSAYSANRYPPELVEFLKTNGKRKVLFGSNAPMIPHGKALADLPSLALPDEVRDAFLFGNAKRVFKLGDAA